MKIYRTFGHGFRKRYFISILLKSRKCVNVYTGVYRRFQHKVAKGKYMYDGLFKFEKKKIEINKKIP